ncbi:reticulophagy regulator 3 isoform X1 [Macrobrachium rosenbergii]|uniref:reticulophagy regulator 3 isoform X1 n=1 Tax=Macrobrachium rosenbergii TaxID=79674 RepID=UPI0034D7B00C
MCAAPRRSVLLLYLWSVDMFSWKSAILRLWPFKSENSDPSPVKPDTRKLNRVLGPWEAYMVTLQSILIWERPGTSAVAVVAVNVLFWLLVWSELRIIFVMAVTALLVFLHQQWVHSIWPEIRVPRPEPDDSEEWTPVHPRESRPQPDTAAAEGVVEGRECTHVLSVPEISQYVEGFWRCVRDNYNWLLHLRRVQPALFCAIVSTVLSVFAVMGHLVPGVVLLYVLLMLFMTGPGIVLHVLPDSFFQKIARIRAALRGEDSQMDASNISMDSDINEFLPELRSPEAQAALDVPLMSQDPPEVEQMVEEAYLQEDEMSSTTRKRRRGDGTTYFASGLPEDFPSYDNDSVEDLDGPDIDLPEVSQIVPEASHSRQGSDHYQMKFVSSHFGDSSEEDDDFTEGLTFEARSEVRPEIQHPQTSIPEEVNPLGQLMSSMIAQNAGNVLSALGQNLVTSVIGQSVQSESLSIQQQPRQQLSSSARMTRSYDQQQSVTDLEEDFELISDEEFQ